MHSEQMRILKEAVDTPFSVTFRNSYDEIAWNRNNICRNRL